MRSCCLFGLRDLASGVRRDLPMTTPGGEVAPKVMFASTIDSDGSNDPFASSDEDEDAGGIAGIFNLSSASLPY